MPPRNCAGSRRTIIALDTPDKAPRFLNTEIYYNNDHAAVELAETAMSPRQVLRTGLAHGFEGALLDRHDAD